MRATFAVVVVGVVVAGVLAGCATTTPLPPPNDLDGLRSYLDARVRSEMDRTNADTVAVVVVNKDGPLWSKVYGGNNNVTIDSHFRVGSLSKLMTALTTLSLRDDHKIDIDAPITDVIPWFAVKHRFDTPPI